MPPVSADAYRLGPSDVYIRAGGVDYRYDVYLPAARNARPAVVVFVHGDGPPDIIHEPRKWGQYRSWAALTASRGLAAITFDHASTKRLRRLRTVVSQIEALLDLIAQHGADLGVDGDRIGMWSGSAGVPLGLSAGIGRQNVKCHVAFYGPMELSADVFRAQPALVRKLAEFSPLTHLVNPDKLQPTLIIKAGLDRPVMNDSIDTFVARAREVGAPVQLLVHDDGRHAFDVLDDGRRSRELIDESLHFLISHLVS
jgi:acetyl esterase/lipase